MISKQRPSGWSRSSQAFDALITFGRNCQSGEPLVNKTSGDGGRAVPVPTSVAGRVLLHVANVTSSCPVHTLVMPIRGGQ